MEKHKSEEVCIIYIPRMVKEKLFSFSHSLWWRPGSSSVSENSKHDVTCAESVCAAAEEQGRESVENK